MACKVVGIAFISVAENYSFAFHEFYQSGMNYIKDKLGLMGPCRALWAETAVYASDIHETTLQLDC